MRLNIKLIRKIQKRIIAHPEKFQMSYWGRKTDCGTACCIAGHALQMNGYRFSDVADGFLKDGKVINERAVASKLLGIRQDHDTLFLAYRWPDHLRKAYYDPSATPGTRAFVAAARLEHLVEHHA